MDEEEGDKTHGHGWHLAVHGWVKVWARAGLWLPQADHLGLPPFQPPYDSGPGRVSRSSFHRSSDPWPLEPATLPFLPQAWTLWVSG